MSRCLFFFLISLNSLNTGAQTLFFEDCFIGGVQTGGHRTIGELIGGSYEIQWEEDYTLRRAFALTYRYGRPEPFTFFLNGQGINWNNGNQAGPELPEENSASNFLATHAVDITENINIEGSTVILDFPGQPFNGNWGYWGAYIVLLYESPQINSEVCTQIYVADQTQDNPQNYEFAKPDFDIDHPLLFSIYSDRLTEFEEDATDITLNNELLGRIWSPDLLNPVSSSGVQGHFYYENGIAEGLNGDTANTRVLRHDGIAIINEYLNDFTTQDLNLTPISWPGSNFGFNPHPAFLLTYTPNCGVNTNDMPRAYSICRGDSVQFDGIAGYDNYSWNTAETLSDSAIASPWCSADSSRWYTLRMWNDDGNTCPKTIPVHITVNDIPRPESINRRFSECPEPTGEVIINDTPGDEPITYTLGGLQNTTGFFNELGPDTYDLSIQTATGCTWDSTIVLPLNPIQEASFIANPDSGFSPLEVFFNNTSTNATGFQWLINDEPISTNENLNYTFADSGSFEIALVAYRFDETCTDTAFFTLNVKQGIQILLPNIISPNGDGRNDQLVATLFGVESIQWTLFNRWGEEVIRGSTLSPEEMLLLWSPDEQTTEGAYFIAIIATGEDGNREEITATVTVVR